MEIKVIQNDIANALSIIQGVVERKTTMPILSNALITADGKETIVTATDLEVGVKYTIPAEVIKPGRFAAHAKSLYDIIKEMPSKQLVSIKVNDANVVFISCGEAKFKISGLPSDEFPVIPSVDGGKFEKIKTDELKDMIDKTFFSISADENRRSLNGLYIEKVKDGIRMVSTDGHRLSILERKLNVGWDFGEKKGIIIPKKGVMEIKRVMEGVEDIEMLLTNKYAVVRRTNVLLIVRLLDEQFPPFLHAVPKSVRKNISVTRGTIVKSLRLVSALASEIGKGVKFTFSPKNLELFFTDPNVGEARDIIEIDYKGQQFSVAFNGKYFLDVISVLEDEEIGLDFGDETAPCVIRPLSDKGFTHIIMPMRF